MAVAADSVNEVCGCAVGCATCIDPLYCKIENVFVQQEFMLHALGLLERFQVFGKLSQALVKEAGKTSFNLPLFVHF